jgi:hypothetical protein
MTPVTLSEEKDLLVAGLSSSRGIRGIRGIPRNEKTE